MSVRDGVFKPLRPEFTDWPRTLTQGCTNGTIVGLDFVSTQFSQRCFEQLIQALSDHNCSVKLLDLSRSNFIDLRAENLNLLADALAENPKTRMKNLNLSYTAVNPDHCLRIANLIRNNTSLKEINLNNTQIKEQGLNAVNSAFRENFYLEEIFVFGMNDLDFSDKSIYVIIARNKNNNNMKEILADTLTQDKGVRWGRSKLMVIGQGGAGKTSTVRALLGQKFTENWDSTIGADLKKTETSNWKEEDFSTSNFNDAAAQVLLKSRDKQNEQFTKLMQEFEKQKKEAALNGPKDKDDEEEEEAEEAPENAKKKTNAPGPTMQEVDVNAENNREPEGELEIDQEVEITDDLFNANHVKLVEDTDVARRFGNKLLAQAVANEQESDPNKITFTIWDYGGQEVFYTLHHLFLTKYGVYLIVFDMTKLVNIIPTEEGGSMEVSQEAIQYLKFWTNSVMLHAPNAPVILVGTHLDDVSRHLNPKTSKSAAKKLLGLFKKPKKDPSKAKANTKGITVQDFVAAVNDALMDQVKVGKNPNLLGLDAKKMCFFAVNNAEGVGIPELRESIEQSARGKYYVEQEIPLRWVLACDFLIEDEDAKANWHHLDQVKNWTKDFGCVGENEVEKFLKLFNELGVLIYLSSSQTLKDRVISEPQWLIDRIGLLIRDDMHGIPANIPSKMHREWKELRKTGIVSRSLLEQLWKPSDAELQKIRDLKMQAKKNLRDKENEGEDAAKDGGFVKKLEEEEREVIFLIELLQNAMLMSPWKYLSLENEGESFFLVPSLLTQLHVNSKEFQVSVDEFFNKPLKDEAKEEKDEEGTFVSRVCTLDFTDFFLPLGVFQRLVCLLAELLSSKVEDIANSKVGEIKGEKKKQVKKKLLKEFTPLLGRDYVFMDYPFTSDSGEILYGKVYIVQNGDVIEVNIQDEKFAADFLEMILALLGKLRAESMGSRLKVKVYVSKEKTERECAVEDLGLKEYNEARKEEEFSIWFHEESKIQQKADEKFDLNAFIKA